MRYKIYKDRLKLYDSYSIPKNHFETELKIIRTDNPDCLVWLRTLKSMQYEWSVHNLAYLLHIRRSKTKDCDLNFEQPWYLSALYWLLGKVALLVIE